MGATGGLLERDAIVSSAAALVDGVGAGGTGALFLIGEAGLGKTSIVEGARRRATEAGLTVGVGQGHPMETGLPFGVLAQAFDGAGGRGLLSQDDTESGPLADGPSRYYRVLRWLQQRVGRALFLALDDLHWADADSVALLAFLCRRLPAARFGLIAAMRPWPAGAREAVSGLEHEGRGNVTRLLPLSQRAAGTLLQHRLGHRVPAAVRQRAFDLSAGNPLLLEQLAVTMGQGSEIPDAASVGLAMYGRDVLLSRFAGLPADGMRCAQAASVLGSSFLPDVAAEVAGLDDEQADAAVEALARTGLIVQTAGAAAEFVHPLFHQALYDDLPGPVRSRLHAKAFTALHGRGRYAQAAEHAVQADLAGHPEAVAVLEEAGRSARRAGATATAVSWLDRAVATAGGRASIRLLMDQAEALLASGASKRAIISYRALLSRPDLATADRIEASWMGARALTTAGQHDLAATAFASAASLARDNDREAAVEILLDAAFGTWLSSGIASAMALAAQARDLASTAPAKLRARAEADWTWYAAMCGDPAGIAGAEAVATVCETMTSQTVTEMTVWRGGWGTGSSPALCAVTVEQFVAADRAFTLARRAAEEANAPYDIAGLALTHSYALARMGRLADALAAAAVTESLTDLVPLVDGYAKVARAYVCLYLGQLEDSARCAGYAGRIAAARGQLFGEMVLCDIHGHRQLREGNIAGACTAYDRLRVLVDRTGAGEPCHPAWARHAVSSYLAAGRRDDAEGIVTWLDTIAPRLPCRFPRIAAATAHAQLAERSGDHDRAEEHHRKALSWHDQIDLPLEHCETLLAYGGFLRRSGQVARARAVLAQAADVAHRAGALWLAGLAHEELKVAGGRLRRRAAPGTLSAQEQRVAALVATGASNADIAMQLSLSVSTIETHLERIYAKLGIHTRYQLIAMTANRPAATKDSGSSLIPD